MFCEVGNQMHETIQQFSVKGNKCIFTNEWCNQTKLKSSLIKVSHVSFTIDHDEVTYARILVTIIH